MKNKGKFGKNFWHLLIFLKNYFPDILIQAGILILSINHFTSWVCPTRGWGVIGNCYNDIDFLSITGIALVSIGINFVLRRYLFR